MKTSSNAVAVAPKAEPPSARVDISLRRLSLLSDASLDGGTRSRIWEPVPRQPGGIPTSSEVLNEGPPKHRVAVELEQRLIDVLTRPLESNETHAAGNANREREVRALFETLSPIDALVIRRRLDVRRADDALVVAFGRLLVERQSRLRAYLADPRRGRSRR